MTLLNAAIVPHSAGQIEQRTHDDKHHGTTSLFAALDVKAAERRAIAAFSIVGQCMRRHRAKEFSKFLDQVEKSVPADLDVLIVMDTATVKLFSGTHKTKLIRDWFAKRTNLGNR